MKKVAELLFIPSPGFSHLTSALEMANLLIRRDERLFITVIIMKSPFDYNTNISQPMSEDLNSRIRFVELPYDESNSELLSKSVLHFLAALIETNKTQVRDVAAGIETNNRLAGFVIDMFCSGVIDVADELGVPTYVYFTSSAGFLGLMFHLQSIQDDQSKDVTQFKDSDSELSLPCFANSFPSKVLPSVVLDNQDECRLFLRHAQMFRRTKGILVNTFVELESYAVRSLSDGKTPPVYPVGPIFNLKNGEGNHRSDAIMSWLDDQPPSSVVFLCFGSMGSFGKEEVKEIADALEHTGYRFLWSLRQPPPKGKVEAPREYENPEEVLPEGFLERTAGMGKVIGWAPQVAVLSHPAVGGFVSHCGWNSILESVWCGVPIAAWPLYAEQQINAFEMVKELGLAVEIKMDYRKNVSKDIKQEPLTAKEIETGIRKVMMDGEIRKKVNEMKEKSREAMTEGGSSYISLGCLIEDVIKNMEFHTQKSVEHE
ncbi:anthocyanidin 3-O-glucosyltransferase 2-like [Cornus florida]|uniref:anthocyanidin 3-O-glucosyltransferase 2-like n=1 Tax=Cornus florida TaxID=4283 RepID=UPI0028A0CAC9|nr:anthocyanidin 3-O-glucosyltransferase 2-like [Cornus florida]